MATVKIPIKPGTAQAQSGNFPEYKRTTGSNFPVTGLCFDAATEETAFWELRAANYGSGNLTLKLVWYADTASSGDVIWGCAIAAITPDSDTQDVETKAFAAAQTVTDSHLGTTGQRLHQCSITISNLDSLAVDDEVWLKIYRDADAAGDTMSGDVVLLEAELSYSDS